MKYLNVARDALVKLANKLRRLLGMEKHMQRTLQDAQRNLALGNQAAALATKRPIADQILDAITWAGPMTRRELSGYLERDISSLCAALKMLTKQGVLSADQTVTCRWTGKEVTLYDMREVR